MNKRISKLAKFARITWVVSAVSLFIVIISGSYALTNDSQIAKIILMGTILVDILLCLFGMAWVLDNYDAINNSNRDCGVNENTSR